MKHDHILVPPHSKVRIEDYDPGDTYGFKDKRDAQKKLTSDISRLSEFQTVLYAAQTCSLLIVLQAMDAAGKDGTIKHVMSGVNPQGVAVTSFKAPSDEELSHDYLWRHVRALPARGRIGIHNRSHYEEVLAVRVHPELLLRQHLPPGTRHAQLWRERYEDINAFERHLVRNGTVVLKFFLNVSPKEQGRRLLARIDQPEKNWKFSLADLQERAHWDSYMDAYAKAFSQTSTVEAPWYIVPADRKWVTRLVVADVIVSTLEALDLRYPQVGEDQRQDLVKARALLEGPGSAS